METFIKLLKSFYYNALILLLNPLYLMSIIFIYAVLLGWIIGFNCNTTSIECSNNNINISEIISSSNPSSSPSILSIFVNYVQNNSSTILGFCGGTAIVGGLLLIGLPQSSHPFLTDFQTLKSKYTWEYLDDCSGNLVQHVNSILLQKNEGIGTALAEQELVDRLILLRGELANYCNHCLVHTDQASFTCMSDEMLRRLNLYIGLFVTDTTIPPLGLGLSNQLLLTKEIFLTSQLEIQHVLSSRGEHIPLLADKLNPNDLKFCLEESHSTWFGHCEYSFKELEYSLNYVNSKIIEQNKIEYGYQSKHSYFNFEDAVTTDNQSTSPTNVLGENLELVVFSTGAIIVFSFYLWNSYRNKSK
jgi:hypothetical protein